MVVDITQRKRSRHIYCLMVEHIVTNEILLKRKPSDLNLIEPLDFTTSVQGYRAQTIILNNSSKIQTLGGFTGPMTQFLQLKD